MQVCFNFILLLKERFLKIKNILNFNKFNYDLSW